MGVLLTKQSDGAPTFSNCVEGERCFDYTNNVWYTYDGILWQVDNKTGKRIYSVKVVQSGSTVPTITVNENTLSGGIPVWARTAAGNYSCVLAGAFTVGKTIVLPYEGAYAQNGGLGYFRIIQTDLNTLTLYTGTSFANIIAATYAEMIGTIDFQVQVYA